MSPRISKSWDWMVHCTRNNVLWKIDEKVEEVEDVNLDDLWKYIFDLWTAPILYHFPFPWPNVPGLQDLKGIVLLRSDLLIKDIHGDIKAILGRVNVATVAPLVIAHTLERLAAAASITNFEELWHLMCLTEDMYDLAIVLKELSESESPEGTQDVMKEATALIVEGARVFSLQGGRRRSESEVDAIRNKLSTMKRHVATKFAVSDWTPIHQWRSHLSKEYPTHAVFKMEALVAATNGFDEDNKVGEGGFGAVYKGTTHHGKQIAVKKMSFTDERSREFMKKQFENEKLPAEFQHPNIVNLLGSCEQESQGFLVYEYFPNGSLDKFLFVADKHKELDWKKQYNIILGLARGLHHLQQDSQQRIVHRDFKTSNILLDDELKPKIADFGTAKVLPEDRTHVTVTTKSRVGTYGYMPLEYIYTGKISERTDVYSFGIVLLEILTGEKISSDAFFERVWRSYKKKKFVPTIDPTMTETEKAKALRCIQVGLLCIQGDLLRPTMSQVITMLSTSENLPLPKKPPLVSSTEILCYSDEVENDNSTSMMEK